MLILDEADLRRVVDMPSAVAAVEHAFARLSRGEARVPPAVSVRVSEIDGEFHVKGARFDGGRYFVLKVASTFFRNAERGLPTGNGLMTVFDAETGAPVAVLLDGGYLTDLRTGAAGGVVARHLAPLHVTKVAVLGSGVQARLQLEGLGVARRFDTVSVWSRTSAHARTCALDLERSLGVSATPCERVEDAVRDADVVVTTTAATEPVLHGLNLGPGVHVTAVGADGSHKRELDAEVLARADVIVADLLSQCRQLGELQHLDGARLGSVVELGDLVTQKAAGRRSVNDITVCDLTGVGIQDAAIAELAINRSLKSDPPQRP